MSYGAWVQRTVAERFGGSEEPLRTIAVRFFTESFFGEGTGITRATVADGNHVQLPDGRWMFHPQFVGVLRALDDGNYELAARLLNGAGCTLDTFARFAS